MSSSQSQDSTVRNVYSQSQSQQQASQSGATTNAADDSGGAGITLVNYDKEQGSLAYLIEMGHYFAKPQIIVPLTLFRLLLSCDLRLVLFQWRCVACPCLVLFRIV